MKLTCAIIDDEPLAVELLESYVRKTPFLELKGAYNGGITALEALKTEPVDLLFCDIQMPELSGMELSRMLPTRTRVVFTTAFDRYAVEGLPAQADQLCRLPDGRQQSLRMVRTQAPQRRQTIACRSWARKHLRQDRIPASADRIR